MSVKLEESAKGKQISREWGKSSGSRRVQAGRMEEKVAALDRSGGLLVSLKFASEQLRPRSGAPEGLVDLYTL